MIKKKISKELRVNSWNGRVLLIKQKKEKRITLALGWNGIRFEREWHWILTLKKRMALGWEGKLLLTKFIILTRKEN